MAMSAERRERLLGMILMGLSTRTACDNLNVLYCDFIAALDTDEVFRLGYLSAATQRDHVGRALEEQSNPD